MKKILVMAVLFCLVLTVVSEMEAKVDFSGQVREEIKSKIAMIFPNDQLEFFFINEERGMWVKCFSRNSSLHFNFLIQSGGQFVLGEEGTLKPPQMVILAWVVEAIAKKAKEGG